MGTVVPEGGVSPSLARMMDDMAAGRIDAVLHVGDMAYDMGDDGGHNGDLFMNQIQPIASMLPYMVTLGATAVAIPHIPACSSHPRFRRAPLWVPPGRFGLTVRLGLCLMQCNAGNHEGGTDFSGNLHHYVHRFNMPMKAPLALMLLIAADCVPL